MFDVKTVISEWLVMGLLSDCALSELRFNCVRLCELESLELD